MWVDKLKNWIGKFLRIEPSKSRISISVYESSTREVNTMKNDIWYRGDPSELEQFWKEFAIGYTSGTQAAPSSKFWSSVSIDPKIRKVHSGIPRMMVDKFASIVSEGMKIPDMEENYLVEWNKIAEDNSFQELMEYVVAQTLALGDGAFKISVDTDVTKYPIIEYYAGNKVDFIRKRGRIISILFYTDYEDAVGKQYKLVENYSKGSVDYKLVTEEGKEVLLTTLPETADLVPVKFDGEFIMGLPLMFNKSAKWKGRGDSIFEIKGDLFDALDESLSTWVDSMRANRTKQYIPESMIPRDENNGTLLNPDVFNNFYVVRDSMKEDANEKIETVQGDVSFDGLQLSYITFLDSCLQGIISPSTLGIDVKKLDNAESQREKEKTTLYTRDSIISVLAKVLPNLVDVVLNTKRIMDKQKPEDSFKAKFDWDQYANPSFEAQVETIGKARTLGIMSVEQAVEELYGDRMSDEDKTKEIDRIKDGEAELVPEPSIQDNIDEGDGNAE